MNKFELSKDQKRVVEGALEAYSKGCKVIGIEGEGGTGKTTVLKSVLGRLGLTKAVMLTAPTHDACEVIKKSFEDTEVEFEVKTVYSLLGMRLAEDQEEISVVPATEVDLSLVRCVVVDECSMVGSALYSRIQKLLSIFPNVLWIFTGDSFQLKPVKDTKSKVFTLVREHASFRLIENMRMKKDSPVLSTIKELRSCIEDEYFGALRFEKEIHNDGSVYVCSLPQFNTSFANAVTSDKYNYNAIVALAYTNARVTQLNNIARTALYGDNPEPYYKGEILLTAEAIKEGTDVVVHRNARGKLNEVLGLAMSPKSYDMENVEVECYTLHMTFFEGKGDVILYCPTDKGLAEYNRVLNVLYKQAKQNPSRYNWYRYHSFRTSVDSVRNTYAMTVHRSQGRDFSECVYVDNLNIQDKCRDRREVYHLLNVAISRTRKDVIISQRT